MNLKPAELQPLLRPGQTWTAPNGSSKTIVAVVAHKPCRRFSLKCRPSGLTTECFAESLARWIVRHQAVQTAGRLIR